MMRIKTTNMMEILVIVISLFVLFLLKNTSVPKEETVKIGIAVYNLDDPFVAEMTEELTEAMEQQITTDRIVRYEIVDAKGNVLRQQSQIQYLLNQDCDVLLLNLVQPATAASVLNQTDSKQIPVILFNREPNEEDLKISARVWYVGTDGRKAGQLQEEILKSNWESKKSVLDRNKDGEIDYILMEGESTHYDTIRRTESFIQNASEELSMNQLADLSGNWMRQTAYEELAALSDNTIAATEAIICNNDDMALGAYDFFQEKGIELPLIIGINKTKEMKELVDQGALCGTVDINSAEQIQIICNLITKIISGDDIQEKRWYASPNIY